MGGVLFLSLSNFTEAKILKPSNLTSISDNILITKPVQEKKIFQLTVLMKNNSKAFSVDKINLEKENENLKSIFGDVVKAKYLITKSRGKIGISNNLVGLTPEEIDKKELVYPDLKLLHPQSVEARLNQYIVLSYKTEKQLKKAKERLAKNPNIIGLSTSTDNKIKYSLSSNDTFSLDLDEYQYGLFDSSSAGMNIKALGINSAWDKVKGHSYVGIVDSGLDINSTANPNIGGHPDFVNAFRSHFSFDFSGNDGDVAFIGLNPNAQPPASLAFPLLPPNPPTGNAGHGQHVSGIILADNNNNIGTSGICWNCSLSFTRALDPGEWTDGLNFIAHHGSQVVNQSYGNHSVSNPIVCDTTGTPANFIGFCDALELVSNRDIVNVASAGNGTWNGIVANGGAFNIKANYIGEANFNQFPASDARVISVGAVDINGTRANFSDFGSQLDLVAPGVNILSTMVRGYNWNSPSECGDSFVPQPPISNMDGYGLCTGTSMSAPHVTGISALIRSADPLLNRFDVKDILIRSASEYPTKNNELGYGIPNGRTAVDLALGTVNGEVLDNRLTPLFSFYSTSGQDSFYTTVPQMATASIKGTLLPQPSTAVDFYPTYGSSTYPYIGFPDVDIATGGGFGPPVPAPTARAEVYVFTTDRNPLISTEDLVPLYRLSYQGANGANSLNLDHVYTTSQVGINTYKNVGYLYDGIEGYIYSNTYSQPEGTVGLHRRYNPTLDDHAIFPENQLTQMINAGYTVIDGNNSLIGYVYANIDSDNDQLIDGFEKIIGTCYNDADTNNNGQLDGVEVHAYPRIDPLVGSNPCVYTTPPAYPWQENAVGTQYMGYNFDYAMGYHFTPLVNGTIDQLGGFFNVNAAKQVKLFDKATGQLLAQVTVTSAGNWSYTNIAPVAVQANQSYTVAVYLAGSGGTLRYNTTPVFPMTIDGNFTISSSTYISTLTNQNAIPTNIANLGIMYGQVDLRFTPN